MANNARQTLRSQYTKAIKGICRIVKKNLKYCKKKLIQDYCPDQCVLWTQLGSDIDGEAAGDASGNVSLSADGDTVAIGAFRSGSDSGHVRVYKFVSNVWTQLGSDIDGEAADDRSGSVSLSANGETVTIGAYQNDGNGSNSGHVRVYKFVSNVWTQLGSDIDGEAAGDNSGYSVSLSDNGETVAIGSYGNGSYSGHVRVYRLPLL
eukprot:CAMPEP_0184871880 /NCGR_PEP_ID=MMETSP0580-20130426/40972_1 /TAXON_ID=1118495 /ORGANISM="Dactyliosolen fragilissimus" /LENGTH=205 /DNA_ID=CAMNT_0027374599 /DNA_START=416 /DNA_END=1033 /DNA_ORIENTATION=+